MTQASPRVEAGAQARWLDLAFDGTVAEIGFAAGPLNLVVKPFLRALSQALAEVEAHSDVRCLIVHGGAGRAFCAGSDINEFAHLREDASEQKILHEDMVLRRLARLPVPTVAAIDAPALGGGFELALACDFIVASEKAVFGQPEVNLGIVPGFGGTQRLTRLVGKAMAIELCTTGRQVKADEALRIGLVNHVVPAGELMGKGLELASMIAQKAPVAVKLAKHLVQRGQDMDLANANAFEADVFGLAFGTDDRREGMSAFLAKRKPAFGGR